MDPLGLALPSSIMPCPCLSDGQRLVQVAERIHLPLFLPELPGSYPTTMQEQKGPVLAKIRILNAGSNSPCKAIRALLGVLYQALVLGATTPGALGRTDSFEPSAP